MSYGVRNKLNAKKSICDEDLPHLGKKFSIQAIKYFKEWEMKIGVSFTDGRWARMNSNFSVVQ
jgi:hypothetical protein